MNAISPRYYSGILVLLLAAFGVSIVRADSPQVRPLASAGSMPAIGLLEKAYAILAMSNDDYGGHRVRAMNSIKAACHTLGSNIHGHSIGGKPQPISDDQLRAARDDVSQARDIATQNNEDTAVSQMDRAVKEINLALARK